TRSDPDLVGWALLRTRTEWVAPPCCYRRDRHRSLLIPRSLDRRKGDMDAARCTLSNKVSRFRVDGANALPARVGTRFKHRSATFAGPRPSRRWSRARRLRRGVLSASVGWS